MVMQSLCAAQAGMRSAHSLFTSRSIAQIDVARDTQRAGHSLHTRARQRTAHCSLPHRTTREFSRNTRRANATAGLCQLSRHKSYGFLLLSQPASLISLTTCLLDDGQERPLKLLKSLGQVAAAGSCASSCFSAAQSAPHRSS